MSRRHFVAKYKKKNECCSTAGSSDWIERRTLVLWTLCLKLLIELIWPPKWDCGSERVKVNTRGGPTHAEAPRASAYLLEVAPLLSLGFLLLGNDYVHISDHYWRRGCTMIGESLRVFWMWCLTPTTRPSPYPITLTRTLWGDQRLDAVACECSRSIRPARVLCLWGL